MTEEYSIRPDEDTVSDTGHGCSEDDTFAIREDPDGATPLEMVCFPDYVCPVSDSIVTTEGLVQRAMAVAEMDQVLGTLMDATAYMSSIHYDVPEFDAAVQRMTRVFDRFLVTMNEINHDACIPIRDAVVTRDS